ncbi:uncharacterized protein A4U43_C05F11550 [Asparagus officinalis]|uniref:Uncharacterized protein n=1 Tax=Asparagus officinalis TaxID=4686 RepID=A0A5P1EWD6_ASPOF|nr:uncharacterized protein A4U43_C05F11550 [Asparagus officinalis]
MTSRLLLSRPTPTPPSSLPLSRLTPSLLPMSTPTPISPVEGPSLLPLSRSTPTQVNDGIIFPHKAYLYLTAIEDAEYKDDKIECEHIFLCYLQLKMLILHLTQKISSQQQEEEGAVVGVSLDSGRLEGGVGVGLDSRRREVVGV